MRRYLLALASVSALSALLVGCSGGAEEGGGAPPAETPSATSNQTRPVPRDQVQDGGTFTYPLQGMPTNFNYSQLDGTLQDNAYVIQALMPALYTNDADSTPRWDPNYLASEPALITDPVQVLTFQVNPKAVWYDGTPITWEDFYWQWKASNGLDKAYQISSANGYEEIESVKKGKDEREVVVTFKNKYADWQNLFNPFYPSSTNKDPKLFNEGWKNRPLTTAGPFRLDSVEVASQTITLVRNEKWWGDRAKLDRIVFRVIEPDAHVDALANGEVDAVDVGGDANKFSRAKEIAGSDVRTAGGPNFRHLTINGTGPILQDVKVRQALAMAIDRAAIARALLGPLGISAVPLSNHIFMANQAGYEDTSGEIGTFNPDKARQLLDEAGWKLDGNVRRKAGKPLEINGVIPGGVATSKQEMELMQNMLAQVGAKLNINTVPINDFFAKYVTLGQFDFTVFAWMGTPYPISSVKSIYTQPKKGPKGELDIQQNFSRTGSDEIDRLLQQATQELDHAKAVALANQIDRLIWQQVHSLTLYQRPELIVCKRNLVNFGAFGFATPWRYQDIGWAKPTT
jgi:peptide/nickel transport system substrate-binding protein